MADKTQFVPDLAKKSIYVSRVFNAQVKEVWRAYTESEWLDQWWGPAPWRAETKVMDFREGGYWLYAMVGPEGERHWSRVNYKTIQHHKSIDAEDGFCDEEGNMNTSLPVTRWKSVFTETAEGTLVEFTLLFATEEDLKQITEMGFEEGFKQGLDQLDALLQSNQ